MNNPLNFLTKAAYEFDSMGNAKVSAGLKYVQSRNGLVRDQDGTVPEVGGGRSNVW